MDCGATPKLELELTANCWTIEEAVFIGSGMGELGTGLGCLKVGGVEKLGGGGGGGTVSISKSSMSSINPSNPMMSSSHCNVYTDSNS